MEFLCTICIYICICICLVPQISVSLSESGHGLNLKFFFNHYAPETQENTRGRTASTVTMIFDFWLWSTSLQIITGFHYRCAQVFNYAHAVIITYAQYFLRNLALPPQPDLAVTKDFRMFIFILSLFIPYTSYLLTCLHPHENKTSYIYDFFWCVLQNLSSDAHLKTSETTLCLCVSV